MTYDIIAFLALALVALLLAPELLDRVKPFSHGVVLAGMAARIVGRLLRYEVSVKYYQDGLGLVRRLWGLDLGPLSPRNGSAAGSGGGTSFAERVSGLVLAAVGPSLAGRDAGVFADLVRGGLPGGGGVPSRGVRRGVASLRLVAVLVAVAMVLAVERGPGSAVCASDRFGSGGVGGGWIADALGAADRRYRAGLCHSAAPGERHRSRCGGRPLVEKVAPVERAASPAGGRPGRDGASGAVPLGLLGLPTAAGNVWVRPFPWDGTT